MTRVLLTGASGFIATHILDLLLAHGHSVRITVRDEDKAQKLISAHPEAKDRIDYAIVPDISKPGAFDEAVKSDPPFEAVLHTASPFHFNVTNAKTDLLDPAIQGTNSILEAIYKYAPTVTRVVITSSFAAIIQDKQGKWAGHAYSEADWNPVTIEEAENDARTAYRASKTLAEKAAWDFVEQKKPNFSVSTINPPIVFGPVKKYIHQLDKINTSNSSIADLLRGGWKEKLPQTPGYLWVDARDVAAAHVAAFEKPQAAGKRFFITSTEDYSTQLIADILVKNFPEHKDLVPVDRLPNNGVDEEPHYTADNSRSKNVLGLKYRTLEESIVDTIKSLKELEGL